MRSGRIAIALLLLATGCQSARWLRTDTLEDSRELRVEREQSIVDGKAQVGLFAHPAQLEPDLVVSLLSELHYRRSRLFREDENGPVVPAERRSALARALSEALREADSSERVRFRLQLSSGSIFGLDRITRGVAFVQPAGVLNIALDHIEDVPDDNEAAGFRDPTVRSLTQADLDPAPNWRRSTARGAESVLWVLAPTDPAAFEAAPPEEPPSIADPSLRPETSEPDLESRESDAEMLAQLRLLERLHRDGAITTEEFDRRRREILEGDSPRPDR